jgi:hypothetical protein
MTAKRLILTIIVAGCALLVNAGCQEETATQQRLDPRWFDRFPAPEQQQTMHPAISPDVKQAPPKITFDKVVHDFGDVGPLTERFCEFKFTNTGDGTLKIGQIDKTCGCTPFLLEKTEYAPGESGSLKVMYYAETQLGQTTKNLTIHSNDQENPQVTLAVKAKVMSKVDYEPKALSLVLNKENAGCPNITLESTDGQPFSISYLRSTDDFVTADFDPSVRQMKFVIEPKVDMARLGKTMRGNIEIGLTHPECKTVRVRLNTLPKFKVARIIARATEGQKSVSKTVRIISNYADNFAIASATSERGTIRVVDTQAINKGYELDVEITPPAKARARVVADRLIVKTTNGEQLEIPCTIFLPGATASEIAAEKDKDCPTCGPKLLGPSGVITGPSGE